MNEKIAELIERIRRLEEEIEAERVLDAHPYYNNFGDATAYRGEPENLRRELERLRQ